MAASAQVGRYGANGVPKENPVGTGAIDPGVFALKHDRCTWIHILATTAARSDIAKRILTECISGRSQTWAGKGCRRKHAGGAAGIAGTIELSLIRLQGAWSKISEFELKEYALATAGQTNLGSDNRVRTRRTDGLKYELGCSCQICKSCRRQEPRNQ